MQFIDPTKFSYQLDTHETVVNSMPLGPLTWRHDFHKTLHRTEKRTDAFPYTWNFGGVRGIKKGEIVLHSIMGPLQVEGDCMVFVPPFSILEMDVGPVTTVIESVRSLEPLPGKVPDYPVALPYSKIGFPKNAQEVFDILQHAEYLIPLCHTLVPSAPAIKTKRYIDAHFSKPLKILEIAKQLKLSRSVMSRYFHKSYGMSPLSYLNTLRVIYGIEVLSTQNKSISDVSEMLGFSDTSTFHRQFKSIIQMSPISVHKAAFPRNESFRQQVSPEALLQ